ncbi:MAG TPA: dihydrodipicolinate synthase family protein [Thermoanaerobaculia bacterium]
MELELKGVIPPVVLPLDADEEIDENALRREARFLLDAGVDALLVNGTTSEGAMISAEESRRVCEIVVEEAGGRLPVIAGVIADSTREALHLGRLAREAGAAALMVSPVHFLNIPTRAGIVGFFRAIGREVGLPLVLYNVAPQLNLRPDLCLELAEIPEVVAIKQSNDNFHELADLLRLAAGRIAVLTAIEDLLFPSLVLGSPGMIVAVAALVPELCVELYRAVQRGDLTAARRLHERILPVVRAVLVDENFPATMKAALALRGRPVGPPRSPLTPCSPEVEATLRRSLREAGVLP